MKCMEDLTTRMSIFRLHLEFLDQYRGPTHKDADYSFSSVVC